MSEERDELVDGLVTPDAPVEQEKPDQDTQGESTTEAAETKVDAAESPEAPAPEVKPHQVDKGLQAVQQSLSAMMRRIEELDKRVSQPAVPAKKDDLDDIIAPDSYADEATKKLAERYRNDSQQIAQQLKQQQAAVEAQRQELFRMRFKAENPGIDYDEVIDRTTEIASQFANDPHYAVHVQYAYKQVLDELKAKAARPAAPAEPVKASSKPDKPTDGTRITNNKSTGTAKAGKVVEDPYEVPQELIDGLVKSS